MSTIAEKYAELKTRGFVPSPDLPVVELPLPDLIGKFFAFTSQVGPVSIFWHPASGAFEVYGLILNAYTAQSGPLGPLGYPVSGEYDDISSGSSVGRISDFQRGSISWYRSTSEVTTSLVGPSSGRDSYEYVAGIDVSKYQGVINWPQIVSRGTTEGEVVAFAYIKATQADTIRDDRFAMNWASSAGRLPRGAYHYFFLGRQN